MIVRWTPNQQHLDGRAMSLPSSICPSRSVLNFSKKSHPVACKVEEEHLLTTCRYLETPALGWDVASGFEAKETLVPGREGGFETGLLAGYQP